MAGLIDLQPMSDSFRRRVLEMPDTLRCRGRHSWRHRSREDKACCGRADRIADHLVGRNVAAADTEPFRQSSLDNVDALHDAVALRNPGAAPAIEADGVNFVEIGERAVLVCQIADLD